MEAPMLFSRPPACDHDFLHSCLVNMGMVSGILPVVGAAAVHQLRRHRHGHAAWLGILMSIAKAKRLVQS
jgi:hypothetical protein